MKKLDDISQVVFYLPFKKDGLGDLPTSVVDYWPWILRNRKINKGKYGWTLLTYLQLREAGLPVVLATTFPKRGMVISHRDFLPIYLVPRSSVLLVCIKPDRKEHTWAHHYIVQNINDDTISSEKGRDRTSVLPYWPQPSLIPRRLDAPRTCQNVAYVGRAVNLAPELRSPNWSNAVAELGLSWAIPDIDCWHDYSVVDITVSIRSFEGQAKNLNPIFNPDSKPPSKLINSWLAGVPAIVGVESAFRSIRKSELDFIEVATIAELKEALLELKRNKRLYEDMVANGLERAREFSVDEIVKRWQVVLQKEVPESAKAWRLSGQLARSWKSLMDVAKYFAKGSNLRDLRRIVGS